MRPVLSLHSHECHSNTTLVKVKLYMIESDWFPQGYSNTTLVKVKLMEPLSFMIKIHNSNTTLVKVKSKMDITNIPPPLFKYNTC